MDPTPAIPIVPCCPPNGGGDAVALLILVGFLFMGHGIVQLIRNRKGNNPMKNWKQGLLVGALLLATGLVMTGRQRQSHAAESVSIAGMAAPAAAMDAGLPALLKLGADRCIPCRQMNPIVEELQSTFAGRLHVESIDVWKDPEEGKRYGVRVIPLLIFFDAEGRERHRAEGIVSREDILAKWEELGVDLTVP